MRSRLFLLPFCVGVLTVMGMAGCATTSKKHARFQPPVTSSKPDQLDFENPPLTEEEYEAQQRGEVPPKFDIPVVRNAKVEQWIAYFQGRGRKWFTIYMERSGKYVPFMRKILREHDLPEDLVYLAMIESGFSTKAYSRARAVGPWQFMQSTGRLYGLNVNFWVDERRDPERSTIAAARHLKDLYDQFQSWKLAAAAYNAGAGKVGRAIRRYRTEDFWELARGRYLRPETRHYVPKMIAAALIAKEPAKYGFREIEYQEPLKYDKLSVGRAVNLIQIAEASQISLEELLDLNPELNHPVTPPNAETYELRIPAGSTQKLLDAYEAMMAGEQVQYAAHRVRRGDNLGKIASIYRVNIQDVRKLNGLASGSGVRQGQMLLIPVPLDGKLSSVGRRAGGETSTRKRVKQMNSNRARPQEAKVAMAKVHIVRRGENLSRIARKYGVSVAEIKEENNLRRVNHIWPGKRLSIPRT